MTVVRGTLSIALDDLEKSIQCMFVINNLFSNKMNVRNFHDETQVLIVVKAPVQFKKEGKKHMKNINVFPVDISTILSSATLMEELHPAPCLKISLMIGGAQSVLLVRKILKL